MRAVYKDTANRTYSCPVEIRDNKWQMKTSEGFQDITFHFDDDIGGRLFFVEYREDPKPEDSRLHIDRLPGESSFGALQRAYAEQKVAVERKQREQARAHAQEVPVDAAAVARAREINNQLAQRMRPRGKGQYLVND